MPSYEAAVIVKSAMSRPQMNSSLKHLCRTILGEGGLIKNVENLGHRQLPNAMRAHKRVHTFGHYFCIQFDSSVEAMEKIDRHYKVTKEVVRSGFLRQQEETRRPCLDGPCIFGEIPNPDKDRAAYTQRLLRKYKNRQIPNV